MKTQEMRSRITSGGLDRAFDYLYSEKAPLQRERYEAAVGEFEKLFGAGREVGLFSAPGRTEVGGNHTDHQQGRVLAAGVNLDVIAVAGRNDDNVIRIQSAGFPMDTIDLSDVSVRECEKNTAASLIRGVAAKFAALGYRIGGFDAYTTSSVLKGSGLSSSAAFETIVGTMLNCLYAGGAATPVQIAQIGQYAENAYFGKPSGLMDQMGCSVGGFITIDFQNPEKPIVEKVDFDFAHSGYKLCVVDTGGNHADLTGDYAAAPVEMRAVAEALGGKVLRDVAPETFYAALPALRGKCTDRALLRAFHFYADNDRVPRQVAALRAGDFEEFKRLVIESGRSSFMYLQNVYTCKNPDEQGLSLALAMSEHLLAGRGAWRVHGGGFAGTIQAFVPEDLLDGYKAAMEAVFGANHCHVLSIRPVGGVDLCAL
ncbi:galactokinase [Anaerotruncus massiliensis (ex Liu et al. 2021)]|uniref:Galactokinase n=2 Tax=Anaerotruncus TaxID=244127 RepID=A0A498CM88_9FIRM|nr:MULTISPECIES: galactokinase family protein [Anaerotruncus]MBC3938938.1 galactokinase [Anaerotruncus massiliensis (ex Togo et al. 2019)]RLL10640.1 galactokinase [Anaerotruncus massiliensis (ex Liu et al. 2021)]